MLVTVDTEQIEDCSSQVFDPGCFVGKRIGNVFG